MKKIKLSQDITLNYKCKEQGSFISLYENSSEHPPLLIADFSLQALIKETLNTKSFKGLQERYTQDVIEDLDKIKKNLINYAKSSKEYPDFGFGDNT
jgi:hypothetical protein